jgi:DNA-binding HxlR family transcriptional regulator
MPDFIYDKKIYYNPIEFAMNRIGGTWKMPILWRLREKTLRYGELKKDLQHITYKMLLSVLRSLEAEGFVDTEKIKLSYHGYMILKPTKELLKFLDPYPAEVQDAMSFP